MSFAPLDFTFTWAQTFTRAQTRLVPPLGELMAESVQVFRGEFLIFDRLHETASRFVELKGHAATKF